MRWLLVKDLQILKRSPLLVAVLVLYPITVALLVGFALSRSPERPKVALVDEVPPDQRLEVGDRKLALFGKGSGIEKHIDVVRADSRREAVEKVKSGEAVGALIVPPDTVSKLQSQLERPRVEVLVNEEDPLKARLVDDTITRVLADANLRISRAFTSVYLGYLDLLLNGGRLTFFGQRIDVLGLRNVERITRRARDSLPAGQLRSRLDRVVRFTHLARQNLGLTNDVLAGVTQPIQARKEVIKGNSVSLSTFASAVAVSVSLMFVTVMLAAGSLALERTENAFERLVRGPVTRTALLAEKTLLAVSCSVVVTLVMLAGLALFVPLEWSRFPLWVAGVVAGATAFAAMGTLVGGIARELSVASLLAFALLVPVAFLALVPSGVVSQGVYDFSRALSALFPFKPTLDAMRSALHGEGGMVAPLLHLAALALAFGLAGRLALRRLA